MKTFSASIIPAACRVVPVLLWLSVSPPGIAADTARLASLESFDYAEPKLFTGTLYEIGSERKKILYTFRRTATGSIKPVEFQTYSGNLMNSASYRSALSFSIVSRAEVAVSTLNSPPRSRKTLVTSKALIRHQHIRLRSWRPPVSGTKPSIFPSFFNIDNGVCPALLRSREILSKKLPE